MILICPLNTEVRTKLVNTRQVQSTPERDLMVKEDLRSLLPTKQLS